MTPAGTARTREEARTQRPWTRATSAAFVTGAALVALGAIATIWRGAAVMGNGWRPWALASTGALTALVAWGLWRLVRAHHQVPRRLVSSSLAACAAVVVLFAVGAAVSPVVDGRVVPVTSKEARVQRDALAMRDDLLRLADLDQLLILDATAGRARFSEYQDAVDELDAMSGRWARRNPDGFADAALAPVAADLASAARYASVAMTRKRDLLTTDDSRLAAQVAANRESFSAAVLDAGPRLAAVAERYGFSVAAPRQGPTE